MRILFLLFPLFLAASAATAQERHVGYYYPPVTSSERFERLLVEAPPATREIRVEFVTMMTAAQMEAPANPRFAVFAKGENAQDLIIVALDDEAFRTLFRARAVMAQLSSQIRTSEFYWNLGIQFSGTFYDMLQMLEFDSLVVTDGDSWSHLVEFKR